MKRLHSMTTIALTGILGFSALSAPLVANASEEGKRNTTYALGAAALGLLLTQKNKLPGILAAGGAAYAYSQYNNDVRARHRREQSGYSYDNRYRAGQWKDGNGMWHVNKGNRSSQYHYHRQDHTGQWRDDNGMWHVNKNQDRHAGQWKDGNGMWHVNKGSSRNHHSDHDGDE